MLETQVSCAKTAQLIASQFGVQTSVGPNKHALTRMSPMPDTMENGECEVKRAGPLCSTGFIHWSILA